MNTKRSIIYVIGMLAVAMVARADVLELKDGKVLTDKYLGGTAGTIRFDTGQGVQGIEFSKALALTFSATSAAARRQSRQ